MKLKCSYCRKVFEGDPLPPICPHCGKKVVMPGSTKEHSEDAKGTDQPPRKSLEERLRDQDSDLGGLASTSSRGKVVLIVVAIVIVVVLGWYLFGNLGEKGRAYQASLIAKKQVDSAVLETRTLRAAVEYFRQDCGRYPTTEEGLGVLTKNPGIEGWRTPYLKNLGNDPWEMPYGYRLENGKPVIYSCGPDKLSHSTDDVFGPEVEGDTPATGKR